MLVLFLSSLLACSLLPASTTLLIAYQMMIDIHDAVSDPDLETWNICTPKQPKTLTEETRIALSPNRSETTLILILTSQCTDHSVTLPNSTLASLAYRLST